MKKNLIVYASRTGNTGKIAKEIGKNFEKHGWSNDLKKISAEYDVENPDFDLNDYDFICVGSLVFDALPLPRIRKLINSNTKEHKLTPGPKCGLVFCTYVGMHLGPAEAEPALKLLELELMHREIQVIGSIAVPGKMKGKESKPDWYFGDIENRPDESDLKNIALFVDDIMNELKANPYY
jgi:flavodoxin